MPGAPANVERTQQCSLKAPPGKNHARSHSVAVLFFVPLAPGREMLLCSEARVNRATRVPGSRAHRKVLGGGVALLGALEDFSAVLFNMLDMKRTRTVKVPLKSP